MKLPQPVVDTLTRYVQAVPVPHGDVSDDSQVAAIEQLVREWTNNAVEQVIYEHPGEGWGSKRADAGRPQSKDGMANNLMQPGRLLNWDLVTGAGTGRGSFVISADSLDITGQVYLPLSGVDHIGGGTTSPVEPYKPQPGDLNDMLRSFVPAAANSMDVGHVELRLIGQALGCMDDQGNPSYVNKLDIIAKQVTDLAHASPATPSGFNLTPEMLALIVPVLQPLLTTAVATWLANNNVARVTVTPKK